ncbi:MAG: hypothetical protein ACREFD_08460 [Stellaceae bacterium]
MANAIKTAGTAILGVAILVGTIFVAVFMIRGTAGLAEWLLPPLMQIDTAALFFCLLILLPLSAFRATRVAAFWGFFAASYLFGLEVWLYGFLVTYLLWGGTGVFIGLVSGIVGIVPLGIVAAAFHGSWYRVGDLTFDLLVVFGARAFALFLAKTLDGFERSDPEASLRPGENIQPPSMARKIWTVVWKAVAVFFFIVIGTIASGQGGWSGGKLLFYPHLFAGGHAVAPLTLFVIGLFGSIALPYAAFRIAKWSLLLFVPVMLYSGLVLGLWNGVASNFDYTRGEAIKYHYANAYALQHMSRRAFELSCHDARISLTPDAKALCEGPSGKWLANEPN